MTATTSRVILRSRPFVTAASLFCTLGLVILLTLTGGCRETERQRVRTVSDQFLDAMAQEDWSRAKPLLTEKARDAMGNTDLFAPKEASEKGSPAASATSAAEDYTIGEPRIEDSAAAVPVTFTHKGTTSEGTLRLRREDGEWRVRALRIEGENNSPGITLDFENPEGALLGAAFRAFGEGMGEMLKGFGKGMGAFFDGIEKGSAAMKKSEIAPTVQESPTSSPTSDSPVKIEEHSSGS